MKAAFKRRIGTLIQTLLAAFLLVYAVDWAVFHVRLRNGTAIGTLQVEQYLTTPLKGNKAEFDYMGTNAVDCSRSLFPQAGHPACWWLSRHTSQWQ